MARIAFGLPALPSHATVHAVLARELMRRGHDCIFVGEAGLEPLAAREGVPFRSLGTRDRSLRRAGLLRTLVATAAATRAFVRQRAAGSGRPRPRPDDCRSKRTGRQPCRRGMRHPARHPCGGAAAGPRHVDPAPVRRLAASAGARGRKAQSRRLAGRRSADDDAGPRAGRGLPPPRPCRCERASTTGFPRCWTCASWCPNWISRTRLGPAQHLSGRCAMRTTRRFNTIAATGRWSLPLSGRCKGAGCGC